MYRLKNKRIEKESYVQIEKIKTKKESYVQFKK